MADHEREGGRPAQRIKRLSAAARRAEEAAADARSALTAALYDGERDGLSYGDMAKLAELSKAHVHRLCVAENERRQDIQQDVQVVE